jgi:hypothetical protein
MNHIINKFIFVVVVTIPNGELDILDNSISSFIIMKCGGNFSHPAVVAEEAVNVGWLRRDLDVKVRLSFVC